MADWYMKILPIRRQSVTVVAMSSSINSCRKRNSPKFLHAKSVSTTTNRLLETAASGIQRFEILQHGTSSFDEINTTLYLVHRPKNNQPPLRLAITLSLVIERAPGLALMGSKLPSWCRVAEENEKIEYLAAKPDADGCRSIHPTLQRDSIRHSGSRVLQVFQFIKLLVAATDKHERWPSVQARSHLFCHYTLPIALHGIESTSVEHYRYHHAQSASSTSCWTNAIFL
jgi:hypothetical protein